MSDHNDESVPPVDRRNTVALHGGEPRAGHEREHEAAPGPLRPDGQHTDYWVLSPEERAKGFVRPVRNSYRHVGARPKYPTRPLTDEENAEHAGRDYVLYEPYPESESPLVGRAWTQAQLDSGCDQVTTMGKALAETYARDPKFYGATMCVHCGTHYPVEQFVWLDDGQVVGS